MKKFLSFFVCCLFALVANAQITKYDVNNDGKVNTADVVAIYKYIATGEGDAGVPSPANVKAVVTGKSVVVSWTAVSGATAYTVYRSADGNDYSVLANNVGGNSFTDKAPLEGYNYYVVSCIVDGQTSDYSAVAKVKYEAGIESGLYMGVMCFNDELYTQPITLLNDESKTTFNAFIDKMTMKNATILCYSVDQALDALKNASLPKDLSKVAIVTFTDGLDRGSTIFNEDYDYTEDYLNDLQYRIKNEKIGGLSIDAYSIGLRGNDVTGTEQYAAFKNTLRQLASSDANAKEVGNMAEVNAQFIKIAEELTSSTYIQSLQITLSAPSTNGTKIRFTLDNASSATSSNIYVEGTLVWSGTGASRVYQLTDVIYHGLTTTSGKTLTATRNGVYLTFSISNIVTEDNRLLNSSQFDEWDYTSNSFWTHNSEWEPDQDSKIEVEHSSAMIMLVLDCSSSLGNDFSTLKGNAKNFITTLYNASNSGEAQDGDNNDFDSKDNNLRELIMVKSKLSNMRDCLSRHSCELLPPIADEEDSLAAALYYTNDTWDEAIAHIKKFYKYKDAYTYTNRYNILYTDFVRADSLQEAKAVEALFKNTYYSLYEQKGFDVENASVESVKNFFETADSLVSTEYYNSKTIYHQHAPECRELTDHQTPIEASNGYAFILDKFNFKANRAWQFDLTYELEGGNLVSTKDSKSLSTASPYGVRHTVTEGNRNPNVEGHVSDGAYQEFIPSSSAVNPQVAIKLGDDSAGYVLSGTYDIYVVIVPENMTDVFNTEPKANKFTATLTYDYDDKAFGQTIKAVGPDNDAFWSDVTKVDTILLFKDFKFETCYYEIKNSQPLLIISSALNGNDHYTCTPNLNIDCVLLVAKDE